jgi:hypothetical protein
VLGLFKAYARGLAEAQSAAALAHFNWALAAEADRKERLRRTIFKCLGHGFMWVD